MPCFSDLLLNDSSDSCCFLWTVIYNKNVFICLILSSLLFPIRKAVRLRVDRDKVYEFLPLIQPTIYFFCTTVKHSLSFGERFNRLQLQDSQDIIARLDIILFELLYFLVSQYYGIGSVGMWDIIMHWLCIDQCIDYLHKLCVQGSLGERGQNFHGVTFKQKWFYAKIPLALYLVIFLTHAAKQYLPNYFLSHQLVRNWLTAAAY